MTDDFGKIQEPKRLSGIGSGGGQRSKDTTDDYRALAIWRWQQDGLMTQGRFFGWNWTCDGETVASIQVRAESRVLCFRQCLMGGHGATAEAD
ncbi:MAG: hypothetical protein EPN21_13845 [Methylococcaceae bacterium]|nr:MAG: hypothetical protein EPN21_13845 [Methylococcaceae bacterium]